MDEKRLEDHKSLFLRMSRLCSVREYSEKAIVDKLKRYDVCDSSIEEIINRLKAGEFLNEARFCRTFIMDKSHLNRWGRNRIIYELRAKHQIDKETIERALSEVLSYEDQLSSLIELLRSKSRVTNGDDATKRRYKLIRFAYGRGFEYSMIEAALKEIGI